MAEINAVQFGEVHLVRHGEYNPGLGNFDPEGLTSEGVAQSERAAQALLDYGVEEGTLLLSSDAPRALQTADIIGQVIRSNVIPSLRINVIGHDARGVASLDAMFGAALRETGNIPAEQTNPLSLVVVTHLPLLALLPNCSLGNGQVTQYAPGSWPRSEYDRIQHEKLSWQLQRVGLAYDH